VFKFFETKRNNMVTDLVPIWLPISWISLCIGFQNTEEKNILLRSARRDDHNGIHILVVRSTDQKSIPVSKMLLFCRNKVNGAVDVRIWKNEG
jgi:hypothetical protein